MRFLMKNGFLSKFESPVDGSGADDTLDTFALRSPEWRHNVVQGGGIDCIQHTSKEKSHLIRRKTYCDRDGFRGLLLRHAFGPNLKDLGSSRNLPFA